MTVCVFQTRSDEEDAENDELNDTGESLAIPSSSVGRARTYTIPESTGLVRMGSEQATALQHSEKTTRKGTKSSKTLARANKSYFKLKTPNLPQKSLDDCVEARAFLSEQKPLEKSSARIMELSG